MNDEQQHEANGGAQTATEEAKGPPANQPPTDQPTSDAEDTNAAAEGEGDATKAAD